MQDVFLCFVCGNLFKIQQRGKLAETQQGFWKALCRFQVCTYSRRKRPIAYRSSSRLSVSLSLKEDNANNSEVKDDSASFSSKSERKVDSEPVSSSYDTGAKNGNPKRKRTSKKKQKNKKEEPEIDGKVVTVPIARKPNPSTGIDYWIDPKDVVEQGKKTQVSSSKTDISSNMKDKLKTEIVSPYRQNWILLLIAAAVLLTLAYRFLPTEEIFDHIPDL